MQSERRDGRHSRNFNTSTRQNRRLGMEIVLVPVVLVMLARVARHNSRGGTSILQHLCPAKK